jgi:hypothetical protein
MREWAAEGEFTIDDLRLTSVGRIQAARKIENTKPTTFKTPKAFENPAARQL